MLSPLMATTTWFSRVHVKKCPKVPKIFLVLVKATAKRPRQVPRCFEDSGALVCDGVTQFISCFCRTLAKRNNERHIQ